VTASFIRELQGRCPRFSQKDHKCLQNAVRMDGPLSHLPQNAREHIYQSIIQYSRAIPSLYTFFKDLIYIKRCRDVLKKLFTDNKYLLKGQRLKNCFSTLFYLPKRSVVQTSYQLFINNGILPLEGRFLLSYW